MKLKWNLLTVYMFCVFSAFRITICADQWVLNAQKWVNSMYFKVPNFIPAPENGKTGWPTMYSLTRALQYELGLSTSLLSNNFGPTTASLITQKYGEIGLGAPKNIITIVQSALYCKGYSGDGLSGKYSEVTQNSIRRMRSNMGLSQSKSTLNSKEMKALLSMDAYLLLAGGRSAARAVQQWMNTIYQNYPWFSIIPTDGHYSRDVQKALVYAIQTTLNVPGANGNYGPGTRRALGAIKPLTSGSSGTLVRLFQAAIIFNGFEVPFDGSYTAAVANKVGEFQNFVALLVTKMGDYRTWSSLLISTGDPERRGSAADCVTEITLARGKALYAAGYRVIGRYLTNVPNTSLNKKIQPGELKNIFASGLRVFPIYQTYGGEANYFNSAQGRTDAKLAVEAANNYGFKFGTIIYFAVDFDALDDDITNNVIPHFKNIREEMNRLGSPYQIGVYAPRNACSRLAKLGLTVTSFVADLSSGFSGNLGFPMPANWAFDQISTISIGSGLSAIEIDNNIASGRDHGQSSILHRPDSLDNSFLITYKDRLLQELEDYQSNVHSNKMGTRTMLQALNTVLRYDTPTTSISRLFGVRKALIQAVIFWEYWKFTPLDIFGDLCVRIGAREDSSTGIAQIFAATAVRAHNWAVEQNLIMDKRLDEKDKNVLNTIWNRLHTDDHYTVKMVVLVLLEGAHEVGVNGIRTDYTDEELKKIFSHYNGYGKDAEQYGREVFGIYKIFDCYNKMSRSAIL